jgi:hypothetical protein
VKQLVRASIYTFNERRSQVEKEIKNEEKVVPSEEDARMIETGRT